MKSAALQAVKRNVFALIRRAEFYDAPKKELAELARDTEQRFGPVVAFTWIAPTRWSAFRPRETNLVASFFENGRLKSPYSELMDIRKAVITAAGPGQRMLPLQTLVDRDGKTKTALAIIVEEALNSGAEDICVVVFPGDADAYRAAAGPHGKRLQFVEQEKSLGYGHAIWSAHEFTGREPFLLLVGDHLYLSREQRSCARQLIEVAAAENCAVSAVQATHESKLPYYGVAGGRLAENRKGLYLVSEVLEKPTPTVAEQRLIVPGLRAGHYLCFFGMHVLTPAVMDLLGEELTTNLSQTLAKLANRERYLAYELQGRRFDVGLKYGLLTAQLAFALSSPARPEVLAGIVELLAEETR